jgi:Ca2+/H+ antiporter
MSLNMEPYEAATIFTSVILVTFAIKDGRKQPRSQYHLK